jgi:hypothetical protein
MFRLKNISVIKEKVQVKTNRIPVLYLEYNKDIPGIEPCTLLMFPIPIAKLPKAGVCGR